MLCRSTPIAVARRFKLIIGLNRKHHGDSPSMLLYCHGALARLINEPSKIVFGLLGRKDTGIHNVDIVAKVAISVKRRCCVILFT